MRASAFTYRVTVGELADVFDSPERSNEILVCYHCGAEYSAHKGDYWQLEDDHIFECCNQPLMLMTKSTAYNPVKVKCLEVTR